MSGDELDAFTDRREAIALFTILRGRTPDQSWPLLPILTFIAPGGSGKSTLFEYLKRKECAFPNGRSALPYAHLDFNDANAPKDLLSILVALRNQLQSHSDGYGRSLRLPRFDLGAAIALTAPRSEALTLVNQQETRRAIAESHLAINSLQELGSDLNNMAAPIAFVLFAIKWATRSTFLGKCLLRFAPVSGWQWYRDHTTDSSLRNAKNKWDLLFRLHAMSRPDQPERKRLVEEILPAAFAADLYDALVASDRPKAWNKTTNVVLFLDGFESLLNESEKRGLALLRSLAVSAHRNQGKTDPLLLVIGSRNRLLEMTAVDQDPSQEEQTAKLDEQTTIRSARDRYERWQQEMPNRRDFLRLSDLYLPVWLQDFGLADTQEYLEKLDYKFGTQIFAERILQETLHRVTHGHPLYLALATAAVMEAQSRGGNLPLEALEQTPVPPDNRWRGHEDEKIGEYLFTLFLRQLSEQEQREMVFFAVPRAVDEPTLRAALDLSSDQEAHERWRRYRSLTFLRAGSEKHLVLHPLVRAILLKRLEPDALPESDYQCVHRRLRAHYARRARMPGPTAGMHQEQAQIEEAYHALAMGDAQLVHELGSAAQDGQFKAWAPLVEMIRQAPVGLLQSVVPQQAVGQLETSTEGLHPLQIDLIDEICNALSRSALYDSAQGQEVILTQLLPFLEQDQGVPGRRHVAFVQCRQTLVNWLARYPFPQRAQLREQILQRLLSSLQSSHPLSACWTTAQIGFRSPPLVTALWEMMDSPQGPPEARQEVIDTALGTLIDLGVPQAERGRLLTQIEERMQESHETALMRAVQQLADPSTVSLVKAFWLLPSPPTEHVPLHQQLALSLLATITDAHWSNASVQDQVWTSIEEACTHSPEPFLMWVYLGGTIVQRCDSASVVPTLLKWLGQEGSTEQAPSYHRYLLYNRVKECVRPYHLLRPSGSLFSPSLIPIVQADACKDTGYGGRGATQEMRLKELAWETLLYLEHAEALTWVEEGIVAETNPYLRKVLCSLLASFHLASVPPQVERWVTEEYDASSTEDGGRFYLFMAATELLWSAASLEAFEVLCSFSYTYRGAALEQAVDVLSDVALVLVRAGETNTIIPKLIELAAQGKPHQQGAAIAALERLAYEGHLGVDDARTLGAVIRDTTRSSFERGKGAACWGSLADEDWTTEMEGELISWAEEDEDWLGWRSLESLARHNRLLKVLPRFAQRLGLQPNNGIWERVSGVERKRWGTYIIGLLYQHHPDLFASALIGCLEPPTGTVSIAEDRGGVLQVAETFKDALEHQILPSLPPDITQAFLRRAAWEQTSFSSDAEIFQILAELCPESLAQYPWQEHWHNWRPDVRAALADALGRSLFPSDDESSRAAAQALLVTLAADGSYGVRRSAYRALSTIAPHMLFTLCLAWSGVTTQSLEQLPEEDVTIHLRERAAEATAWIPSLEETPITREDLFQYLASDVEATVRTTVERSWNERRERQWSRTYLDQILKVGTETAQDNQDILAVWRYGRALMQVGDDACLWELRTHLRKHQTLLPHIRAWLVSVINGILERWHKVTGEWPEPWAYWEGRLEAGTGALRMPGQQPISVRYALWLNLATSIDGHGAWGGTLWSENASLEMGLEGTLEVADQRQGKIILSQLQVPQSICLFQGHGPYPEQLAS